MKRFWTILLLSMSLLASPAIGAEKALCPVCRVKEGHAELETVHAERTHEGVRYTFCSQRCADEFALDPAAYVPPRFPRPAPALPPLDLSGQPLGWEGLKGRVVLVDFWATWCAPCRKAMPRLQALHDKYAASGFMVLGVSIDEDGPEKVRKHVAAKKLTYPMTLDTGKSPAWQRFRVKAVPAAYLVDGEGFIVAQWTGGIGDLEEMEEKVRQLLVPSEN